jgi:hypothetical protein
MRQAFRDEEDGALELEIVDAKGQGGGQNFYE